MARTKGPKKIKQYPDEFKIKALQIAYHPDILAKDVAEDLGVYPILINLAAKYANLSCRA
jgi:hypothetical protein